ncbi:hypothetical protein PIB30_067281 [Stylosanthes scabra]|uniref:Uncharacterized protein n=1 Tax=Stylosanthes scabra TaxID=79078 RepID=A0ABU6QM27_9FABA|nr:hypothetical protein [Stylosanthes scabra]
MDPPDGATTDAGQGLMPNQSPDNANQDLSLNAAINNDFANHESNISKNSDSGDFEPWMMVKRQIRRKNEKGKPGFRGVTNNRGNQPNWESHETNVRSHDTGSRYDSLNDIDSEEENTMQVTDIQKRILKPGAGKNTQTHRKGPSRYGPIPPKNNKGKNRTPDPPTGSDNKPKDPPVAQVSSLLKEEVMVRDKLILEDMRRLNKEQVRAFEASKLASKSLESFVVKNPFLTQNPLFIRKDGAASSSSSMEGGGALKKKPPDLKPGDNERQPMEVVQVNLD